AAYIQPYAGYIYNPSSRLYIHGFHSVAIPTDSALPLFMANDIGAGLWLYRNPADGIIQAILPTIEIHVNTPFTNRDDPTLIGQFQMRDSVNLTMGTYIMFPRSVFGGGVSVPLA